MVSYATNSIPIEIGAFFQFRCDTHVTRSSENILSEYNPFASFNPFEMFSRNVRKINPINTKQLFIFSYNTV